jgi:hypothetical protein
LNNRTRELTNRGDEIYPMNNSTRADKIYPGLMDDKSIRPVSSNTRLVRRNDTYKSIDSLANEVFDASADDRYHNCFQK